MKTVSILGATGSVGTSTLDIVERHPDLYRVVALTAAANVEALARAALRTRASLAVISDESRYAELRSLLSGSGCRAASGPEGLREAAADEAEWVMAAIVGCAGLEPVMAAVSAGRTVALANKEALVTAGALMTDAAAQSSAIILPVDSEHNAIFQCLGSRNCDNVRRLVLTASGGPFRTWTASEMANATPEQAVAHPNWTMGAKISVDSATMMNKGLELIEAHHLFGLPSAQIDILVHPQAVALAQFEPGGFSNGDIVAAHDLALIPLEPAVDDGRVAALWRPTSDADVEALTGEALVYGRHDEGAPVTDVGMLEGMVAATDLLAGDQPGELLGASGRVPRGGDSGGGAFVSTGDGAQALVGVVQNAPPDADRGVFGLVALWLPENQEFLDLSRVEPGL